MKWIKHDTDAHRDAKLRKVKIKYGMSGYGLYWYCLELIAADVTPDNINFELEHDAEIIAHDTGINYELVQEMMAYMINLDLFENSGGVITCMKLAKRLDKSMTSNPQMRSIISNIRKNHDSVMTQSANSHDQIRLDKIRLDKKKKGRFTPPTLDQVIEYAESRKSTVDPNYFFEFFTEADWHDTKGNKVKSWKQKFLTWESHNKEPKKENYGEGGI